MDRLATRGLRRRNQRSEGSDGYGGVDDVRPSRVRFAGILPAVRAADHGEGE